MGLPWLKLQVDFPDNPKVARLAHALGRDPDSACGLIVRLWTWAARVAPTGVILSAGCPADGPQDVRPTSADMSEMASAAQIIEWGCRWTGAHGELAAALAAAGLLDEVDGGYAIHDWEEHAGAQRQRAERDQERKRKDRERKAAKRAAERAARSAGRPQDVPAVSARQSAEIRTIEIEGEEEREGEIKDSLSSKSVAFASQQPQPPEEPRGRQDLAAECMRLWNDGAPAGIPRIRDVDGTRRKKVLARCADHGGTTWLSDALAKVRSSPFLRGERGFKASFDWIIEPGNLRKVLEGNYDDGARPAGFAHIDDRAREAFRTQVGEIKL